MKFSQFIDVFVAALYLETELSGQSNFRMSDILKKYNLELKQSWSETLFEDYDFTSRVTVRRHIGPVREQDVSLSPVGLRWVEDELGENVSSFLEQNGIVPNDQSTGIFDPTIFDPEFYDTGQIKSHDAVSTSSASEPTLTYHPPTAGIDRSKWTGLQPSARQKEELAGCLQDALVRIETLGLDQERKAQARALIIAAQVLAEAPEPPFDILHLLALNFDRLIGVSGWMIGAISLILGIS